MARNKTTIDPRLKQRMCAVYDDCWDPTGGEDGQGGWRDGATHNDVAGAIYARCGVTVEAGQVRQAAYQRRKSPHAWRKRVAKRGELAAKTFSEPEPSCEPEPETVRSYRHPTNVTEPAPADGPAVDPDQHLRRAPAGYRLRGVSTWDKERGCWIKTEKDPRAQDERFLKSLAQIGKQIEGEREPTPAPAYPEEDLMVVIPWGDPHFGMYAAAAETGSAWDLSIAERAHAGAMYRLIAGAPRAARCHIILLGDNLHAPDNKARTPKNGNPLDTDGRWWQALDSIVRCVRYCADLGLDHFPEVVVNVLRGNHEGGPGGAYALAYVLHAFYSREPRLTCDPDPGAYQFAEWGKNLIGMHHGDGAKGGIRGLNGVMGRMVPEAWGRTRHRRWYTGHVHHDSKTLLTDGCVAETMATLAAKDAHAAAGAYAEQRNMKCDVFHREHGWLRRDVVGIDAVLVA